MKDNFIEYEDGTHTGVVPEDHKDYRTYMYKRINGEMQAKICTSEQAVAKFNHGWRASPAEFSDDKKLREHPDFIAMADDMAQIQNTLLNLEQMTDRQALTEFAEGFMRMKPFSDKMKVPTMIKRIKDRAYEIGLLDS